MFCFNKFIFLDGAIILAFGEKGLIQCFDLALQPIFLANPMEAQPTNTMLDLGKYFKSSIRVKEGF